MTAVSGGLVPGAAPLSWPLPRRRTVRIVNEAEQFHEAFIVRLAPGKPGKLYGIFDTVMELNLENGAAETKLSASSQIDPPKIWYLQLEGWSAELVGICAILGQCTQLLRLPRTRAFDFRKRSLAMQSGCTTVSR